MPWFKARKSPAVTASNLGDEPLTSSGPDHRANALANRHRYEAIRLNMRTACK
jgi:hypothetical protein